MLSVGSRKPILCKLAPSQFKVTFLSLDSHTGRLIIQAPWLARAEAEELLRRRYPPDVALLRRIGGPGELKGPNGMVKVLPVEDESHRLAGRESGNGEEVRADA
jgi:hypothetical protein